MLYSPPNRGVLARMMDLLQQAMGNVVSPPVLFFALGAGAAVAKSDLELPEALGKSLSLYLMLAIGFKGGAALEGAGLGAGTVLAVGLAVGLSLALPVAAFGLLRLTSRLGPVDAAALSAHYGSISIVTFLTAAAMLADRGVPYRGELVAMAAFMETPAVVSGLLLARRGAGGARLGPAVLRKILLSGSVVLLLGSLAIGWASGQKGMAQLAPFIVDPFQGVLCLFLLDMGLLAGRRLGGVRAVGWPVAAFGIYMPLLGAALGLGASALLGYGPADGLLLMTLAASASYIVVPAAMRMALPQANPAIYVTVSLAITFPFNIVAGIPLYTAAARAVLGGG